MYIKNMKTNIALQLIIINSACILRVIEGSFLSARNISIENDWQKLRCALYAVQYGMSLNHDCHLNHNLEQTEILLIAATAPLWNPVGTGRTMTEICRIGEKRVTSVHQRSLVSAPPNTPVQLSSVHNNFDIRPHVIAFCEAKQVFRKRLY